LEVLEAVPPNLGPAEDILGPVIPFAMPEKITFFCSLISVVLVMLIGFKEQCQIFLKFVMILFTLCF
jgi:hypothetical protein